MWKKKQRNQKKQRNKEIKKQRNKETKAINSLWVFCLEEPEEEDMIENG